MSAYPAKPKSDLSKRNSPCVGVGIPTLRRTHRGVDRFGFIGFPACFFGILKSKFSLTYKFFTKLIFKKRRIAAQAKVKKPKRGSRGKP